ncbi:hypothetical protein [Fredinandcohnia quinoae]|uniref:Lipoprotein n=1 Tax=Fredinandcohnia quinoae TaxID=2918902 RepID=A0AAW5EAL4_9BACI|nr:hypothetical protein [Fredinandcohnia sp. SECRCQ15]MCH1626710.1 hypothetical protein [Fredinandcohnia sp. SECRCQ15]
MRRKMIVFLSICFLFLGVVISSCLLKKDNVKDIIKYDGRNYSNISDADWLEEEIHMYQKGEKIGEIKRNSKLPFLLWNFSATKLPKGTILYNTVGTKEGIVSIIILAETENGDILYYRWLPKE